MSSCLAALEQVGNSILRHLTPSSLFRYTTAGILDDGVIMQLPKDAVVE